MQWLESIDRLNLPIPTLKALDFPKEMENILALGAYSEKPGDTAKWLDSMGTSASWFSLNPKIREICISHGWDIRASIQKILETVFEEERLDWAEKAAWFALWAAHGKKQSAKLMKETLIAAQFSLDLYSKKPLKDLKGIESLVERSFFAAIHNERLRN